MLSILKNIWDGIKGILGWLDKIFEYVGQFFHFLGSALSTAWGYLSELPLWLTAPAALCLTVGVVMFILGRSKSG